MNYKILNQDLSVREVIPKKTQQKSHHKRGYIPHIDSQHLIQSVTFRLADSLPRELLVKIHRALRELPEQRAMIEKRKKIEFYQDKGLGCCALRHPEVAQKMCDALLHFNNDRYTLHAWTVMPNHVHVLFSPKDSLGKIMHSWKSYTAKWILNHNEKLGLGITKNGEFWQKEYWDRYIRNEQHFHDTLRYIEENPVKAGLVREAKDWRFGSAFYYARESRRDAS